MKIRALTPQQSRMLALSLLLVLVALVIATIAVPVFWLYRHYDQAIEQQLDLLARYSRIGATAPGLTKQLEALKAREARGFFLKSSVSALAASEVQEFVKGVVESNDGKIASMQIPGHKDDGNYRRVTVNIQIIVKLSAAQKIFYALETQRPYLILDNVSIRPSLSMAPRSVSATEDPEFLVQFEVAGYAVLGAKK
ncbi:MAG: type II secretion system protein GspM [Sulfuricella sp.]